MRQINFYFFRHGQTDWNKQKKCQGHSDIPLNQLGRDQALQLSKLLAKTQLDVIYSSDLKRAFATAEFVRGDREIEIISSADLRETHMGDAEGMFIHHIIDRYGIDTWESFRRLDAAQINNSLAGGETRAQVLARVHRVLKNIIEHTSFVNVGLSVHGGLIRNIVHSMLPDGVVPIAIPNCVTYLVQYERGKFNATETPYLTL